MDRRVVITGRGAVSPFGLGVDCFCANIWQGNSAIREMVEWREIDGLGSSSAAPVPDFDHKIIPRQQRRTMEKMAIYATIATQEAVANAGVKQSELSSGEVGVAIGSTTGSPAAYEHFYSNFLTNNSFRGIKSGEFFKFMGHSCAANVCLALGITGEQWGPVSACTSSSQAIGLGYLLLKAGRQKMMLCGGAEEVHPSVTGIFDLLGASAPQQQEKGTLSIPFSHDRTGVICGGGSGIILLEERESAIARGATIYGEITGFGNVTDCGHIAQPNKESMKSAMTQALHEAGTAAAEIDYVNAHATGTELGDVAEALAIGEIMGSKTAVSSLKGHFGHTLGASAALELIASLEMMRKGEIVPTRNLTKPDSRCANIFLPQQLTAKPLTTILKNNFALGGVNTSLIIQKDQ